MRATLPTRKLFSKKCMFRNLFQSVCLANLGACHRVSLMLTDFFGKNFPIPSFDISLLSFFWPKELSPGALSLWREAQDVNMTTIREKMYEIL